MFQDELETVPLCPILSNSGRNIDQTRTGGKSIVQLGLAPSLELPEGSRIYGQILAKIDISLSEALYYYQDDHLGTPQVLTDDQGQVVWKGDYRPFGGVDIVVEQVGNNLRFPGQYYDQETGLHYNYFRDYHPGIGRYVGPDPIGLEGGLNLYVYVLDNPINLMDFLGLKNGFRPPIRLPGPKGPIGAPGDDRPPRGAVIPFVGTTYAELKLYTLEYFFYQGYIELEADVKRLSYPESLKIPCGQTKVYLLCFRIRHIGIDVRYLLERREDKLDPTVRCVLMDIIGIKDCCIQTNPIR